LSFLKQKAPKQTAQKARNKGTSMSVNDAYKSTSDNKSPSSNTFIKIVDDALSPELCEKIIKIFDSSQMLQPGRTGGGVDTSKKKSMDVSIQQETAFQPILQDVFAATSTHLVEYFKEYIFALISPIALTLKHPVTGEAVALTADNFDEIGLPKVTELVQYIFRLGEINAQKYEAQDGGYPYWHSEIYPQQNTTDALHRNLLFMFYLNDVQEGGETEFFYQGAKIKPKAGRMVIAPAGFTHTHRGNVPRSNDKYILTSWVLFNPGNMIYVK
jgi:hypothetical protein